MNLADCKIDARSAVELCKILESSNKSLRSLYFRNSQLGDPTAIALASLLRSNTTMIEVELFNCGVSEKGGEAIGDALRANFCVEKLSIGENRIDKRDVDQIQ